MQHVLARGFVCNDKVQTGPASKTAIRERTLSTLRMCHGIATVVLRDMLPSKFLSPYLFSFA